MMRKVLALVALFLAFPLAASADDVSVADLVSDPAAYDGELVGAITIEGELIGDFQRRGSWVWVQINGDAYATNPLLAGGAQAGGNVGVGARIAADTFADLGVDAPGGYRVRGPIVRLSGEWHHHDAARGGESYFGATSAVLIAPEIQLEEGVRWGVLGAGLALFALSGFALLLRSRHRLKGARNIVTDAPGPSDA